MNAPLLALGHLRVSYKHVFACDNAAPVRKFLQKVLPQPPDVLYEKVQNRRVDAMPPVDYFHFSPPCQSLSLEGSSGRPTDGSADERDHLFRPSLRYIERHLPPLVTMEQVPNIRSKKHSWILKEIKGVMDKCGYKSFVSVLDCDQLGR